MTEQEAINVFKGFKFLPREQKAVSMAINALEKQIPKVPAYSVNGYYYNGELAIYTWECPCCGKQYEVDYDYYKYCPNCGQHIDHTTLTEDD